MIDTVLITSALCSRYRRDFSIVGFVLPYCSVSIALKKMNCPSMSHFCWASLTCVNHESTTQYVEYAESGLWRTWINLGRTLVIFITWAYLPKRQLGRLGALPPLLVPKQYSNMFQESLLGIPALVQQCVFPISGSWERNYVYCGVFRNEIHLEFYLSWGGYDEIHY